ncbi:unnamed protein product [Sphagnum jensenii]|uniref:Uncharacterized protein n=2 Tax=Sphagnum jensenii TaxID=128206 RepID=A0ABP0V823_9BRYO
MAVQLPCRGAALAVSGCVRTQRVTVARAGRRALSDKSAQLLQQRATIRGIDRGAVAHIARRSNRKLEKNASKQRCSSCRQLFLTLHQLCCISCSLFVFFS